NRCAENGLRDFFDAAFANALTACEVRECRRQTRPNTVGANVGGNRGLRHLAATRTGASLGLIFVDLNRDRRQFNGLKAFRFRIVRRGRAWQRRVTVGAFVGYEMRRVRHTFGRQQLLQMRWMIGLSAAFALGLFLADRLSSAK